MYIWAMVAITTILFGSWPLVGRSSGMPPAQMALLVNIITVVIAGVATRSSSLPTNFNFTTSMLLLGALAGIMNGLGHLGFMQIITHRASVLPTGVMMSLVPAVAFFVAVVFKMQIMNLPQAGGLLMIVAGIFVVIIFQTPEIEVLQEVTQTP